MLREVYRELWVLNGIIEKGFISQPLELIAKKFAKIDAVPSGYFYPEIY